jgi:polysaccharide biosynthesis transport protein
LKDREGGALQDEVRLKELEREAKANRDQLEVMLARFADSNTRQNLALQPGYARIIQSAAPQATPYFPKVGPIMLLLSMAGLGLGVGLAFLFEVMAQAGRLNQMPAGPAPVRNAHPARKATEEDFEIPKLDFPTEHSPVYEQPISRPAPARAAAPSPAAAMAPLVLATIPQARSRIEAKALIHEFGESGAQSESMAQLASKIVNMQRRGLLKALAVTGVGGSLEVAASTLALARHLADAKLKTILVDLDGQRGSIPDLMELPYAPGLTEMLAGTADFNKSIQRDPVTGMQVMRHGFASPALDAQLPARMETITNTLTSIYDVVILHIGDARPAMLQLAKGCSTVLVHVPAHRKQDALAAAGTLRSNGFEHVFFVQIEGLHLAAA